MKHTVTLRNGVQVPALGLGTWFLGENKAARAREMESLRKEEFQHSVCTKISSAQNV